MLLSCSLYMKDYRQSERSCSMSINIPPQHVRAGRWHPVHGNEVRIKNKLSTQINFHATFYFDPKR